MRSLWRRLSNQQRTEPVMATQETDPGTTTMEAQETDRGTAQETNPPAAGNEQTNPPERATNQEDASKCWACSLSRSKKTDCNGCPLTPFFPSKEDFVRIHKKVPLKDIKKVISTYKATEVMSKLDELVQESEIKASIGVLKLKEQYDAVTEENDSLRKKLEENHTQLMGLLTRYIPFMDSGTPAAHQTAFDSGFGGSQMTGVGPTNSSHGTDAAYYPPHTGPAGAQTSAYTAYYQHNTGPAEATQILPYQPYLAGAGAQTAYLPLYSAAPGAQTPHVTPYVQAPIILTNMPYSAGNRLQTPVVPAFGIYPPAAESQTAHGLPYAEAPTVLPLTQRPHVPHYPGVQASHMQPNLAGVGVQVPQRPDVQPIPTCAGQQTPNVPPYHAGPGAQPTQPRP